MRIIEVDELTLDDIKSCKCCEDCNDCIFNVKDNCLSLQIDDFLEMHKGELIDLDNGRKNDTSREA